MGLFKRKAELIIDQSVLEFSSMTDEEIRIENNRRLTAIVKGMSEEELRVVADNIPVEILLERIKNELEKSRDFEKHVSGAITKLREEEN